MTGKRRGATACCVLVAWAVMAPRAAGLDVRALRIENRSAVPVDESFVRSHLRTAVGGAFDRAVVADDVRALRETRRFSQVEAFAERVPGGVDVVVAVAAKPRIARLEVRGADTLGNSTVRETMAVGLGDQVDDADLSAAARRVEDAYQKKYRPRARVTWDLVVDPATGLADVTVTVKEGPRARVRAVRFEGNRAVPGEELRKGLLQKRFYRYNPWHWISGAGKLSPDDLDADRYTLRNAYLDRGYLDVEIGEPEVRLLPSGGADVVFRIEEGRPYRIGVVGLEGVSVFGQSEIRRLVAVRAGDPASMGAFRATAGAIADYYGNRGYLRTDVVPETDADPATLTASVTFRVREGTRSTIRDIRVRGNTITKDKVIRRELVVYPGEPYNRSRVKTSERRLLNLGYFSFVNSYVEAAPGPGESDLVFEVEEQRMGQAAVGMGFSSIDALSGYFELSHGNFDLRSWPPVGAGQKMRLRATLGTRRSDLEFSFIEPWFLDRKLSLGVDLFRHEKRFLSSDYDQRNTGGRVSLGRPLGRFNRASVAYGLQEISIFNVSTNASALIREEAGDRVKSEVTLTLTHDTRDRGFTPTRGNRTQFSVGLAGSVLGGDTDLYELQLRSAQYVPLWLGHVLMLRGQAGVVQEYGGSDRVPIFDRFFLGGANTVRGFRYREVGPVDDQGDAVGGRSMFFGSVEYTVPLAERLRAAAFYDTGMVWADAYGFDAEFNSSYGVGVRLDLPMLPLRLDYSWPLEADAHNDRAGGRFSFMIGYGY